MTAYHTYLSRKQIGVIFSNWKKGNVNLTEEQINWLYKSCCEVRRYNDNNSFEDVLQRVKAGLESIFSGEYEEATNQINGAYELYNIIYK